MTLSLENSTLFLLYMAAGARYKFMSLDKNPFKFSCIFLNEEMSRFPGKCYYDIEIIRSFKVSKV